MLEDKLDQEDKAGYIGTIAKLLNLLPLKDVIELYETIENETKDRLLKYALEKQAGQITQNRGADTTNDRQIY